MNIFPSLHLLCKGEEVGASVGLSEKVEYKKDWKWGTDTLW